MQSMDEIYQKYAQTVFRFILSKVQDSDLAEELTQETFYQAVKGIHRFSGESSVSTWLCAIAKNQWKVWLRKNPPTLPLTEETVTGTAPAAEQEAEAALSRAALYKKLHALPEPYRETLYLRLFAGLSYREIGDIFGKTENWARVTFYRGKEKLKEKETDEE